MRIHGRDAHPGFEQEILAVAPPLDSAMEMVIQALRDLESERPLGFGVVGFTPYGAVRTWSRDEGLDRDLFRLLWTTIQKLDGDRAERDAAKRTLEKG